VTKAKEQMAILWEYYAWYVFGYKRVYLPISSIVDFILALSECRIDIFLIVDFSQEGREYGEFR
jgi:hypothetical protein